MLSGWEPLVGLSHNDTDAQRMSLFTSVGVSSAYWVLDNSNEGLTDSYATLIPLSWTVRRPFEYSGSRNIDGDQIARFNDEDLHAQVETVFLRVQLIFNAKN